MIDRACTYTWTIEVEGTKVKTAGLIGTTRTAMMFKTIHEKIYTVIWVEDQATGELREVFANTVKFIS